MAQRSSDIWDPQGWAKSLEVSVRAWLRAWPQWWPKVSPPIGEVSWFVLFLLSLALSLSLLLLSLFLSLLHFCESNDALILPRFSLLFIPYLLKEEMPLFW